MIFPEICTGVCFTGHRTLAPDETELIMHRLDALLRRLIAENGACRFFTGGALGLDTCAALTVLRLKKEYPRISLDLLLPCPDQDKYWPAKDRAVYRSILDQADRSILMTPKYYKGCMLVRDRELVDRADLCVAYLRPGTTGGGTMYTVSYARKQQVPVCNLCTDVTDPADVLPEP